ncbi:hypothetical protein [Vibrio sp. CyArs1]|uniref:hypothetical protein n=1 Tax=Vibrio sp. CyArs1 TaxID=2682577 RepID=UPI001F0678FB|nr:hypothetical protein [Vibrio sp. CyArs1]
MDKLDILEGLAELGFCSVYMPCCGLVVASCPCDIDVSERAYDRAVKQCHEAFDAHYGI